MKAFDVEHYRERLTDAVEASIEYWYDDSMDYGDLVEAVYGDATVLDIAVYENEYSDDLYLLKEVFNDVVSAMGIKAALLERG